ncbi:tRNA (5-methylaminomethyl-2-thiouridine)(34)-methyltransferase MnmD [bacterium]|nr:tRNA (5-methylaminomethyl-2-thiouridine)(34)-methyltransferase MnmD [bacterium]
MSSNPELYSTSNGDHTLYLKELDETYHSRDGAISESLHVFICEGLGYYLDRNKDTSSLKIFELGLGTGLNALLTAIFAQGQNIIIDYTGVEAYPLGEDIANQLNYPEHVNHTEAVKYFSSIHSVKWNAKSEIHPKFSLTKIHRKFEELPIEDNSFDLIFFDAFAPQKQPELWETEIIAKCASLLKPRGVLVTYSAAGHLKRNLKACGFEVEKPRGANGKREMTRGIKTIPDNY